MTATVPVDDTVVLASEGQNVVNLQDYRRRAEAQVSLPVQYENPSHSRRNVTRPARSALDDAFQMLQVATDHSCSLIERSNGFDGWKLHLVEVSRSEELSATHSQLLGALLLAVSRKDLIRVPETALPILLEITNTIRGPTVAAVDVDLWIGRLTKVGLSATAAYANVETQKLDAILGLLGIESGQ